MDLHLKTLSVLALWQCLVIVQGASITGLHSWLTWLTDIDSTPPQQEETSAVSGRLFTPSYFCGSSSTDPKGECQQFAKCATSGGTPDVGGACPGILGVSCCQYTLSCNAVMRSRVAFWQSDGYPADATGPASCSLVIVPRIDTCFIRLQFVDALLTALTREQCGGNILTIDNQAEGNSFLICSALTSMETFIRVRSTSLRLSLSLVEEVRLRMRFRDDNFKYYIKISQVTCAQVNGLAGQMIVSRTDDRRSLQFDSIRSVPQSSPIPASATAVVNPQKKPREGRSAQWDTVESRLGKQRTSSNHPDVNMNNSNIQNQFLSILEQLDQLTFNSDRDEKLDQNSPYEDDFSSGDSFDLRNFRNDPVITSNISLDTKEFPRLVTIHGNQWDLPDPSSDGLVQSTTTESTENPVSRIENNQLNKQILKNYLQQLGHYKGNSPAEGNGNTKIPQNDGYSPAGGNSQRVGVSSQSTNHRRGDHNTGPDNRYRTAQVPADSNTGHDNHVQDNRYRPVLNTQDRHRGGDNPVPNDRYRPAQAPADYHSKNDNPVPNNQYHPVPNTQDQPRGSGNPIPDNQYYPAQAPVNDYPVPNNQYRPVPNPQDHRRSNGNPVPDNRYRPLPNPQDHRKGSGNPVADNRYRPIPTPTKVPDSSGSSSLYEEEVIKVNDTREKNGQNLNLNSSNLRELLKLLNRASDSTPVAHPLRGTESDPATRIISNAGNRIGTLAPYLGTVMTNNQVGDFSFCGATLIAPTYVLTAASCLLRQGYDSNRYEVRAFFDDESDITANVRTFLNMWARTPSYNVKRVIFHPMYDHNNFHYDIAVIELQSAVPTPNIPIALPQRDNQYENTPANVMGHGPPNENRVPADATVYVRRARQVRGTILTNTACQVAYDSAGIQSTNQDFVQEEMVCFVADTARRQVCEGDQGGPLVVGYPGGTAVLVGIISGNLDDCIPPPTPNVALGQYPDIAVRITSVLDFINAATTTNIEYDFGDDGIDLWDLVLSLSPIRIT